MITFTDSELEWLKKALPTSCVQRQEDIDQLLSKIDAELKRREAERLPQHEFVADPQSPRWCQICGYHLYNPRHPTGSEP